MQFETFQVDDGVSNKTCIKHSSFTPSSFFFLLVVVHFEDVAIIENIKHAMFGSFLLLKMLYSTALYCFVVTKLNHTILKLVFFLFIVKILYDAQCL